MQINRGLGKKTAWLFLWFSLKFNDFYKLNFNISFLMLSIVNVHNIIALKNIIEMYIFIIEKRKKYMIMI